MPTAKKDSAGSVFLTWLVILTLLGGFAFPLLWIVTFFAGSALADSQKEKAKPAPTQAPLPVSKPAQKEPPPKADDFAWLDAELSDPLAFSVKDIAPPENIRRGSLDLKRIPKKRSSHASSVARGRKMEGIVVAGNWSEGLVLDLHTLGSRVTGHDSNGHPIFDTTYSHLADLVRRLKYQEDISVLPAIELLVREVSITGYDYVVATPSSNKTRSINPVDILTKLVGSIHGIPVIPNALVSNATQAVKGISDPVARQKVLADAISVTEPLDRFAGKRILVVDDVYRSGATLEVCARALYAKGKASSVGVLAMTKTRVTR